MGGRYRIQLLGIQCRLDDSDDEDGAGDEPRLRSNTTIAATARQIFSNVRATARLIARAMRTTGDRPKPTSRTWAAQAQT